MPCFPVILSPEHRSSKPRVVGSNPTACVAECPENYFECLVGDFAIAIILKRRDSLGLFAPLSPATRTPPRAGKSEETTSRRRRVANESQCRQTFVLQHRIVTLIARNRSFTVDLSGARPRRWKSEFLSTLNDFKLPLRNSTRTLSSK